MDCCRRLNKTPSNLRMLTLYNVSYSNVTAEILPKYLVVPLSGKSLTPSYPNPYHLFHSVGQCNRSSGRVYWGLTYPTNKKTYNLESRDKNLSNVWFHEHNGCQIICFLLCFCYYKTLHGFLNVFKKIILYKIQHYFLTVATGSLTNFDWLTICCSCNLFGILEAKVSLVGSSLGLYGVQRRRGATKARICSQGTFL